MTVRFRMRRFLEKPTLHQDWGEEQNDRKVTWTELFNDLFYVAASATLTEAFLEHPDGLGLGQFLLYYYFFWFTWVANAYFVTRFNTPGLAFEIIQTAGSIAVLGMALFSASFGWHKQFAACYLAGTICLIAQYVIIAIILPRATESATISICVLTLVAALTVVTFFFSSDMFSYISIAIIVTDACTPFIHTQFPNVRLPLHVDHLSERFGLIMMIFLGEGILGLSLVPLADDVGQYVALACAVLVIANMHLTYYHAHPEQDDHALRLHRYRGLLFAGLHGFLGASFLLTAAGLRLLALSYTYTAKEEGAAPEDGHRRLLAEEASSIITPYSSDVAWLVCIPYAISNHLMFLIRATHYFDAFGRMPTKLSPHLKALGLPHFGAWWALGFLWPFLVYFIPFAADALGPTGLAMYIAAHACLFNFGETTITHFIRHHPSFREFLLTEEGQSRHSSHSHQPLPSTARRSRTRLEASRSEATSQRPDVEMERPSDTLGGDGSAKEGALSAGLDADKPVPGAVQLGMDAVMRGPWTPAGEQDVAPFDVDQPGTPRKRHACS